jgi:hypothetical protein
MTEQPKRSRRSGVPLMEVITSRKSWRWLLAGYVILICSPSLAEDAYRIRNSHNIEVRWYASTNGFLLAAMFAALYIASMVVVRLGEYRKEISEQALRAFDRGQEVIALTALVVTEAPQLASKAMAILQGGDGSHGEDKAEDTGDPEGGQLPPVVGG